MNRQEDEQEEESRPKRSTIAGKKRLRETSNHQSPNRKKVKELVTEGELVKKRGRPRLSVPTPVLITRVDNLEPIIRKKKQDPKLRKIRFSSSFAAEYYCNCFDFTTISENKFTNGAILALESVVDLEYPLLICDGSYEFKGIDLKVLKATPVISMRKFEYPPNLFSSQQSIKKSTVMEAEQRSLYATIDLLPGSFISELSGLLCTANDLDVNNRRHSYYPSFAKESNKNEYLLPPFVFHVPSSTKLISESLFLDCRDISCSDGRFVQFSCKNDSKAANAILKSVVLVPNNAKLPCLIGQQQTNYKIDENLQQCDSLLRDGISAVKICIFAMKPIKSGEEIIIDKPDHFLQYPCCCNDDHHCFVSQAIGAIEDYEHSHTGGFIC